MMPSEYKQYLWVAGIAAVSWLLIKLTGLDEAERAAVPAHSADYFSTGYNKWEMGERGQLSSKLLADKMVHFSDDGTTHLDNPVMFFYNEQTPPWIIKSETGIRSADGKNIQLNGKVSVDRAGTEGVRPLKINTTNVTVFPETSYAETDAWAELISPPNVTTGIGMKLTFRAPIHLELLANVRGKYETK
jgi:lipopolysaccharide export system protein LptC